MTLEEFASDLERRARDRREAGSLEKARAYETAALEMRMHVGPWINALQREAHADGVKQGRAEIEQYRAELRTRTVDVGSAEAGEPVVVLRIPFGRARDLQSGLADLLCWVRGYMAALPDNHDRHPMGVEENRALSIALQDGIAKARKVEPRPIF